MANHTRGGLRRGSNLVHVADFNAAVILDAVRRSGTGVSRVELTTETGLAPQTVSDICQRLLDRGMVAETGTTTLGFGRPRRTLQLVPDSKFALGIHVDPALITYVLLDLAGNVVAHAQRDTRAETEPEQIISSMARSLAGLIDSSGVDRSRIVGLGIASPGRIDPERGVVVDPPHLPGWHSVELVSRLTQATGLPVVLDKDVTAAAIAERWAGTAVDSSDFVFLYLGTGVGVGMVTSDIMVRGQTGNAGEIGHLIVDPDGPACDCGQRGCLGVSCMPVGLVRQAVAAGVLAPSPGDDVIGAVGRFARLCQMADAGQAGAQRILQQSATRLVRAIGIIASLLDVELVVLGGPAWTPAAAHYQPVLDAKISDEFLTQAVHGVKVTGTSLGQDVGAIGAACLILDQTFAAQPSSLLLG
jgi:predicted NBD/HSP70 family sugar kinase